MPTLPTTIAGGDPSHISHHDTLHSAYDGVANAPVIVQYVTPAGNDTNDGLAVGTAKLTIDAALAVLPASGANQGGVVFIWPNSTGYDLSAGIARDIKNVEICGMGGGRGQGNRSGGGTTAPGRVTIRVPDGQTGFTFGTGGTYSSRGIVLRNLTIIAAQSNPAANTHGVRIYDESNYLIDNCTFSGFRWGRNEHGSSKTINAASWSAGTATYTTSAAHGYSTGDVVVIYGITGANGNNPNWNGTYTVASTPLTTTFTVAIALDPGTFTGNGTVRAYTPTAITGASYAGPYATYSMASTTGVIVGDVVRISDVTPAAWNITGLVTAVVANTSITCMLGPTPGAYSSGGKATFFGGRGLWFDSGQATNATMYGSFRDCTFEDDNIMVLCQYANGVRGENPYFDGDSNKVGSVVGDQIGFGHLGGGNPRLIMPQFQALSTGVEFAGSTGGGTQGINPEIYGGRYEDLSWGIRTCEAGTVIHGGSLDNNSVASGGTFVEVNTNANGSDIFIGRSAAVASDITFNDATAMLTSTAINNKGHLVLGSTDSAAQLNIRPNTTSTDGLHVNDASTGTVLKLRTTPKGYLASRQTAAPLVGDLVNSEAVIGVLTSDTTLVFYARGSDGTLRSGTVTLA